MRLDSQWNEMRWGVDGYQPEPVDAVPAHEHQFVEETIPDSELERRKYLILADRTLKLQADVHEVEQHIRRTILPTHGDARVAACKMLIATVAKLRNDERDASGTNRTP